MDYVRQTEIDLRLFGMVIALAAILGLIELGGRQEFLSPVNLINLAVQAAPVAIIATRHGPRDRLPEIDLSVGSVRRRRGDDLSPSSSTRPPDRPSASTRRSAGSSRSLIGIGVGASDRRASTAS